MSTTKWTVGMKLTHPRFGTVAAGQHEVDFQATVEEKGWRAVDPPVDAPAEKRERALAPGWANREAEARTFRWRCDAEIDSGRCRAFAPFKKDDGQGESFCEEHTDLRHVFAPPAPAKPVRPADDDRAAWEALVPGKELPHVWPQKFAVGEIRAMAVTMRDRLVVRVDRIDGDTFAGTKLAGDAPGWIVGDYGINHQWAGCSVVLFPADAARAKPAEPKPAPTRDEVRRQAMQAAAESQKKPAPAEKAKREWRAPREMVGGVFNERVATMPMHETSARQVGAWGDMLCGLFREKPPARVFPETRYNATITDAHGKLSRLVESGARADGRQDETRFEAGLRGAK